MHCILPTPCNQVLHSTAATFCESLDCECSSVRNSDISLTYLNSDDSELSSTPEGYSSPDVACLPSRTAVSFQHPLTYEESNLESYIPAPDTVTHTLEVNEEQPRFVVAPKASKRGCDLLVKTGYTYQRDGKINKKGQQRWRCTVRNSNVMCLASVMQCENSFTRGAQPHKCMTSDCALPAAQIKSYLRTEGKSRPFVSGSTIVKEAMNKYLPTDAPCTSLPSVSAMIRSTNLCRQKKRPKHGWKKLFHQIFCRKIFVLDQLGI